MTDQTPQTTAPLRELVRRAIERHVSSRTVETVSGKQVQGLGLTGVETATSEIMSAFTTPQPLAIGLDREAILLKALTEARKIADNATALSEQGYKTGGMTAGLVSGIDRALALYALAAPAEGYVLAPVERLGAITDLSVNLRHGGCDASDLPDLELALETAIDIAYELLPAAPTGGR